MWKDAFDGIPKGIYVVLVTIWALILKMCSKIVAKVKPLVVAPVIEMHMSANEKEYRNKLKEEIKAYDKSDVKDMGVLEVKIKNSQIVLNGAELNPSDTIVDVFNEMFLDPVRYPMLFSSLVHHCNRYYMQSSLATA